MFLQLLLLFIFVPILEISLLIRMGSVIGFWPTLGIVFLTAIVGAALARSQGFLILFKIREELNRGQLPTDSIVEGVVIFAAGLVLLTPGFLTDSIGFLLLIPNTRKPIVAYLKKYFSTKVQMRYGTAGFGKSSDSTEGEVFSTYKVEKNID